MKIAKLISNILFWLLFSTMLITAILLALAVFNDYAIDISSIDLSLLRPNNLEKFEPEYAPDPYIFSGDPVQLAWFSKPPDNGNLQLLVDNFDSFILTKKDEEQRDQLRTLGVVDPIPQYFRLDAIMNPGSCDKLPQGNTVAYKTGDFCWISEEHPDWFLLDKNGERIGGSKYVYMDPGNEEWRAFFLERVRESQESLGWHGVFLDNAEASFDKREEYGVMPLNYPTEESFVAEIEEFIAFLYTNYFQPYNRPLYANIISVRDPAVWFRYLQYLDGGMEEAWAVDWWDGYRSVSKWESHLERVEHAQFLGKEVILVSQGEEFNYERQEFAFASYLLITQGKALFRYAHYNNYAEAWLYDNYHANLGNPLGMRYRNGNEWRRDFENGYVVVNPSKHTAEIVTY